MITRPQIKNTFLCIADRYSPELAAMVSSYMAEEGYYTLLFEIQSVTAPQTRPIAVPHDEHSFSQLRAAEVTMNIRNVIVRLGGCENIILAGLSPDQQSYVQLPEGFNIITIDSQDEVKPALSVFFDEKPVLDCRPEETLAGLQQAVKTGCWLNIDRHAAPIEPINDANPSCVVIENDGSAMAVMAVNYALSINADIKVVEPITEEEAKDIIYHIADWKLQTDQTAERKIYDFIVNRIGTIDFTRYEYSTFFTAGIPYSLAVADQTICTYVHLQYNPDHFTFTNIFFGGAPGTGAALVFSPLDLTAPVLPAAQQEVDQVTALMEAINLHVKQLTGDVATVYNLSRNLQYYPYDILHLCSHGGEVAGKRIASEFIDTKGTLHNVVYDHVYSFAATPFRNERGPIIEAHHMNFPRAYNGYAVGSDALAAQQYAPEFFVECQNVVLQGNAITETLLEEIEQVTDSRSIMCSDFAFQGMINHLAGNMKPLIFNNTCWSWGPVADGFINKGAKGYIGTLWPVGDDAAAETAAAFYQNIVNMPVGAAIHHAALIHQPTINRNIYIFYGFPFTKLQPGPSAAEFNRRLRWILRRNKTSFERNRAAVTDEMVAQTLDQIIAWYAQTIMDLS